MDHLEAAHSEDSGRWSSTSRSFGPETFSKIQGAKVLVIGSGGIGCELLKNLVLSGFKSIEIVDLDTIDISNLNRQFLFRRKHVGQPKSVVARESALLYTLDPSECSVVAHHDDVKTLKYGPEFVKQFDIVLNALDNLSARRHVGRVCWSAGVPYVESGTAGWFGQVQPFIPGVTGCYECEMKPPPTTFPVCTIRSNPSKPIHTVIWAKHLFNLLFGKADDEDSVTDLASASEKETETGVNEDLKKVIEDDSIVLAQKKSSGDLPQYLFHKVFHSDILAVSALTNLWTDRAPPKPHSFESIMADPSLAVAPSPSGPEQTSHHTLEDQKLWSLQKCAHVFIDSCEQLKRKAESAGAEGLSWDKDEPLHLDFVVASSNLRSWQYGIPLQSKFSIKSDAGNIIPAIATTNAIIAGLIVIEAIKILMSQTDKSKSVYLAQHGRRRSMLMNDEKPFKNPSCYVCSNQFIHVKIDTQAVTLKTFVQEILGKQLGVADPSVIVGDDIVYECDEDFDQQLSKHLSDVKIQHSAIVHVESFAFDSKLEISIQHAPAGGFTDPTAPFEIVGTVAPSSASTAPQLVATATSGLKDSSPTTSAPEKPRENQMDVTTAPNKESASSSYPAAEIISLDDDDDDLIMVVDDALPVTENSKKRSLHEVLPSENGHDEAESEAKRQAVVELD
jgi:ubiquitin-like 1-activating enzyme E1 B